MTSVNLRPELARHVNQRVQAFSEGFRHNLAIIGPPGSGKTFQLQQAGLGGRKDLLLVYCPLYRESCRSFLQRLRPAILQAGVRTMDPPPTSAAVSAEEPLVTAAQRLMPKTVAALQPLDGLLARRLYGEAFTKALDAVPVLIQECAKPCVVIFDEFLFLEEMGLGHAYHELGKRVMTWPSTLFVLASSSAYRARLILRERLQLLFGQFELLTLGALEVAPTAAWVAQELHGLRKVEEVAPFVIQWVGSSPWYLTVLLKRLRELASLHRAREVTDALFLQTVWDVLGHGEGALHQWCALRIDRLAHARHGGRAIEALMHVARGARTATELGRRIGRAGVTEALQLLLEHDLAQRHGACWMVTDPVLRCWLSTVFLAQRADAHPDTAEVRRQMEAHLRALWLRWVEQRRLSFPEQVAALFARFHDEMVALDAKTGRLPRFDRIAALPPPSPAAGTYLVADGAGKRWCATIQETAVDEQAIASFEAFCRSQAPKPSRKVIITKSGLDEHARVLAKTADMWVWQAEELELLAGLYDQGDER